MERHASRMLGLMREGRREERPAEVRRAASSGMDMR
jgi:hypothetical protein